MSSENAAYVWIVFCIILGLALVLSRVTWAP